MVVKRTGGQKTGSDGRASEAEEAVRKGGGGERGWRKLGVGCRVGED